jgi:putative oxidoreductase
LLSCVQCTKSGILGTSTNSAKEYYPANQLINIFMATLFLIGRIIFGGYFVYNAYNHFKNQSGLTHYARMKGVPSASAGVFISGVLMLLGGLAIMFNRFPLLGMWLLVVFLIPTTFIMHAFWKEQDPQARMGEHINFMKNIALLGGLFMLIALSSVFLAA